MTKTIITIVRMAQNLAIKNANKIELDKTISSIDTGHQSCNQSYMTDNFSIAASNAVSKKYIENISTTRDVGSQEGSFTGENNPKDEICATKRTRDVEMGTMTDQSMIDLQKGIIL